MSKTTTGSVIFWPKSEQRSRHHTLSTSPTTTKHLFRWWPGVKPTYYCVSSPLFFGPTHLSILTKPNWRNEKKLWEKNTRPAVFDAVITSNAVNYVVGLMCWTNTRLGQFFRRLLLLLLLALPQSTRVCVFSSTVKISTLVVLAWTWNWWGGAIQQTPIYVPCSNQLNFETEMPFVLLRDTSILKMKKYETFLMSSYASNCF